MKTALLNKLRSRVEGFFNALAVYFSKVGLTPNALTALSLAVASLGPILVLVYKSGLALSLVIVSSGLVDAVDGALARLQGKVSKRGAFLDSFMDRVCEAVFAFSLLGLGFNAYLVVVFLALSYLVSYARARCEGLGVELVGVGLMERAERLLFLAVTALMVDVSSTVASYLFIALTALTGVTVVQRFMHAWRALRSS